jgi:hypothetical protein
VIEGLEVHTLSHISREERLAQRLAAVLQAEQSFSNSPTRGRVAGPRLYALILAPVFAEVRLSEAVANSEERGDASSLDDLVAAALAGLLAAPRLDRPRRSSPKPSLPTEPQGDLLSRAKS